jgi:hypothetical protein
MAEPPRSPDKTRSLPPHLRAGAQGIQQARQQATQQIPLRPTPTQITPETAAMTGRPIIPYTPNYRIQNYGADIQNYSNFYLPELGSQTVQSFLDTVQTLEPASRARAYDQAMTGMTTHIIDAANLMIALSHYAIADEAAMVEYGGVDKFKKDYEILKDVRDFREKTAARLAEYQKTIVDAWGTDFRDGVILPYSGIMWRQPKALSRMASIAKKLPKGIVRTIVNQTCINRIRIPARGKSREQYLTGADFIPVEQAISAWEKSHEELNVKSPDMNLRKRVEQFINGGLGKEAWAKLNNKGDYNWQPLSPNVSLEILKEIKMQLHPSGFIIPEHGPSLIDSRLDDKMPAAEKQHLQIRSDSNMSMSSGLSDPPDELIDPMDIDSMVTSHSPSRARGNTLSGLVNRPPSNLLEQVQQIETGGPEAAEHAQRWRRNFIRSRMPKSNPPAHVDNTLDAQTQNALDAVTRLRPSLARKAKKAIITQDLDEEEDFNEDVGYDNASYAKEIKKCICATEFQEVVVQVGARNSKNHEYKPLLDAWYRQVGPNKNTTSICFNHTKVVASQMGIATRGVSHQDLLELLFCLYFNQDKYGDFLVAGDSYQIFKPSRRPRRAEDILLSYRFFPDRIKPAFNFDRVIKVLGLESIVKTFQETGNVNAMIFDWVVKDPQLKHILDEEYKMYSYHCRLKDGTPNQGWGRTQYHSIIQQLIRGDVYYYTLYAVLRRATCLISYPYYTKMAKPGDSTYFRHIDLNIKAAVHSGKMVNMIQGSVSWNMEDEKNCTVLLTGMHKKLEQYQQWREQKKLSEGQYIQAWKDSVDFPPEIQKQLGPTVKWVRNVCKPGEVRISDPRLPHGSDGPATRERRTMLPWFVRVCDDMETMENPPMGTYAELAAAHHNLTAAPLSPSGWPNKYGGINTAFPGAVPPVFSSYISKAIHCQVKWDAPSVIDELIQLFGEDMTKDKYWQAVNGYRQSFKAHALKAWALCERTERLAYGDRSYFHNNGVYAQDTSKTTKMDVIRQFNAMMMEDAEEKATRIARIEREGTQSSASR